MQKLIINCKTGEQKYLNMTAREEDERMAEIALAQEEIAKEEAEIERKKDVLERLKTSASSEILDLLEVLNL